MAASKNISSLPSGLTARMPVTRRMKAWDKSIFETLVLNVGPDRMQTSLAMFSASLKQKARVLADESIGMEQVRYQVHDLASTSGFLGFERLFKRCLELLAGDKVVSRARLAVLKEVQTALIELKENPACSSKPKNVVANASSFRERKTIIRPLLGAN